jgi:uncharacterized protein DUF4279
MRLPSGAEGNIMTFSNWHLEADESFSGDLDVQVAQILDRTTEDLAVWRHLASAYRMDLFCGLFLKHYNEALVISPSTLRDLGEREIKLDLDIYGAGSTRRTTDASARTTRSATLPRAVPDRSGTGQASWRSTVSVSKISMTSPSRMSS